MFNLNVNWIKVIKENFPPDPIVPGGYAADVINLCQVLISPFVKIYDDFIVQYQDYKYKIRFTGQVMYLEKILNDKFSSTYGGIYIIDGAPAVKKYLYRRSEGKPPQYLYRKWRGTYNYVPGDFGVFDNKVYKCLIANNNIIPIGNPSYWVYHKDVTFKKRSSEFNIQYNFIVRVPATLTFDIIAMRAQIDYYRLAGKRYKIETY